MRINLEKLGDQIINGKKILRKEAYELLNLKRDDLDLYSLFCTAARVREHFVGEKVFLCSIVNAKSGRCLENCAFCAQSAYHKTDAPVYPLIDEESIVIGARKAEKKGASCYGIVSSGTSIKKGEELDRICNAVRRIRQETSITPSCSLGMIDHETASLLAEAGVQRYHHNLETARSFFPNICTTHDYEENIKTVTRAKEAGMNICCGGIFGLGESAIQRVEMAFTLRELDVDSIPLNFLNPIPGTRLEKAEHITPFECLQTIAIFRLILPSKRISVCGGREKNLRDLQSWIFFAGASGLMIGNYLTTTGRAVEDDRQMFQDLNLSVAK